MIHKAARNQGVLLKGLRTNSLAGIHPEFLQGDGGKGMPELYRERQSSEASETELEGQPPTSCVESLSCTANGCHLSWVEHGPFRALAW